MNKEQQQKHLTETALKLLGDEYDECGDFNTYFNGEEALIVPSPRPDIGEYRYEKSKVLFWTDREAYNDERAAWEDQTIQERHKETIKLLQDKGHIVQFREVVDAVKRQRIVPFIGAGLSVAMGMPQWGQALKILSSKISLGDPNFDIHMANWRYLEAAEMLFNCQPNLAKNYIRTTFNIQEVKGPVTLLPKIGTGCIVTTNFDNAIEEVFKREGMPFDGYMHGLQQNKFWSRLVKGERCILKLHGDSADPESYIFTKTQYVDAYGEPFNFSRPLPKALRQIYVGNSILFLGCGLEQDWTLNLFNEVKDKSEYEIPNHYAIIQEPQTIEELHAKESRLLAQNIQPIWYPPGQHHFVEKLLQLVIDVAEKRMAFHT